jgi:hypothetical protein
MLFAILAAVLLTQTARAQTPYHSAAGQYSLSLPSGWVQIPDAELRAMMSKVLANSNIRYEAGFQPAGNPWFTYPYVLVQALPYNGSREPSGGEIRQMVGTLSGLSKEELDKAVTPQARGLIKSGGATIAIQTLDEATGHVQFTSTTATAVGTIKALNDGHFGHARYTGVYGYSTAVDWDTNEPALRQLMGTFQFDPGAGYQGGSGFSGSRLLQTTLVGAFVGAIVGGLIGLIRRLRKRA